MPQIVRNVSQLREIVAGWKADGDAVGVVPTMGALHDGHLSLVRAARGDCARVIVTIFVNPKQFNAPADLLKYPRTEEADAALLAPLGVDVVFAPPIEEVYPSGFATTVSVSGISDPLEGAHRPGHFDGVATVVAKLFGMTAADRAYFGQKDWQQLQVVQRLVADLNLAVKITGCETIREADGLAMSSRNAQLSTDARACAPALHAAMQRAAAAIRGGAPVPLVMKAARAEVLDAGFDEVEYIELRSALMLERVSQLDGPVRMLAAAMIGGVRLIDNIAV
ncbi:pantoate--beta-alanine ligase [Pseudorhodobacter aquimaris]|uniref:pantoate--beta-alanine ligase n=1 Tax=Pseudorhodobacter aquimaris TaxID=687412 RepID=UPI0009F93BB8|nr:pantoate--beta-alanine ligase [Pseudorhodobacter aquimaris]